MQYWLLTPIEADSPKAAEVMREAMRNWVSERQWVLGVTAGRTEMVEMKPRDIPDDTDPASL